MGPLTAVVAGQRIAGRALGSPKAGYDLVTTFDCLHDMGDPVGAARHIRESLATDGTPNGLSQPGGYSLGAQAGQAAIRGVVTDGGFSRFRRSAETPFNHVYEGRP